MKNVVKTNVWDRMDWDELRRQWATLHPIEIEWDAGRTEITLDPLQMEAVVGWLHMVWTMVTEQGMRMDDPAIWGEDDYGEDDEQERAEAMAEQALAEGEMAAEEQARAREYWGDEWHGQGIPGDTFVEGALVQATDLPLSDARYVDLGGTVCPQCGEPGVVWDDEQDMLTGDDARRVFMRCHCEKCGHRWVESYYLEGILDEDEEDS